MRHLLKNGLIDFQIAKDLIVDFQQKILATDMTHTEKAELCGKFLVKYNDQKKFKGDLYEFNNADVEDDIYIEDMKRDDGKGTTSGLNFNKCNAHILELKEAKKALEEKREELCDDKYRDNQKLLRIFKNIVRYCENLIDIWNELKSKQVIDQLLVRPYDSTNDKIIEKLNKLNSDGIDLNKEIESLTNLKESLHNEIVEPKTSSMRKELVRPIKEKEKKEYEERKCHRIINFYALYLNKFIWSYDYEQTQRFIRKTVEKLKSLVADEEKAQVADISSKYCDYSMKYKKAKFSTRYTPILLIFSFYLFLLLIDGFYWGQLVLSPIIRNFDVFGGFGLNILHFLVSSSSNIRDAIVVDVFHIVSFALVVILYRVPATVSFYSRLFDFIERENEKKEKLNGEEVFGPISQQDILISKWRVIPTFIIETMFKKKKYRNMISYAVIFFWYSTLSLIPLIAFQHIEIGSIKLSALEFYGLNMSFWFLINFLYLIIGEYVFIVGNFLFRGELYKQIEKSVLVIPHEKLLIENQILRIKQGYRGERIQLDIYDFSTKIEEIKRTISFKEAEIRKENSKVLIIDGELEKIKKRIWLFEQNKVKLESKINPMIKTRKALKSSFRKKNLDIDDYLQKDLPPILDEILNYAEHPIMA